MKNDFFRRFGIHVRCLAVTVGLMVLWGCQSGSNEQAKAPTTEETVGVVDATSNQDSEKQAAPEHKSILEIASDDLKPYLVLIPGLEATDEIPITAKRTFRSDEQIKLDNMELIKFEHQQEGAVRISETVVQFVGFSATVKLKNPDLPGEFEVAGLRFVFFKGSLVRYVQYTRVDANTDEGDVRIGDYTVDHIVSSAASQVVGAANAAIATLNLEASSEDVGIDALSGSGGGQGGSAATSEPVTIAIETAVGGINPTDFPPVVAPFPTPPMPFSPDGISGIPPLGGPGYGQGPGLGTGQGEGAYPPPSGVVNFTKSDPSGTPGNFSDAGTAVVACIASGSPLTNTQFSGLQLPKGYTVSGNLLLKDGQPANGYVRCDCGTELCCTSGTCYYKASGSGGG